MGLRAQASAAVLAALIAAVVGVGVIASRTIPPPKPPAWGPSWPVTNTRLFHLAPRPGVQLLDEEIYLGTLTRVERGEGFYQAQHEMLAENPGRWDTRSPLTYRQPLLTYVWVALGGGGLIGFVWVGLSALSMTAAYLLSIRFVREPIALSAPAALALLYGLMLRYPPRLLYAEMWAGPAVVTAGALCGLVLVGTARAEAASRRLWVLSTLGATCALFALLMRELSLAPVFFMLSALVVDTRARRWSLWLPWLAAVGVWVAAYAVHVIKVAAVSAGDPPIKTKLPSYLHPGLAFLSACVRWASTTPVLVPVVSALCLVAVLGTFTLVRRPGMLVLVGGLTVGTLLLLLLVATPGRYPDGSYAGYWGFMFLPVVVAWEPLGIRFLSTVLHRR